MKTEISKECFISDLECKLRIMSKFLKEDKTACFETVQKEYAALLDFAYVHDLLSHDEYDRYFPSEYCLPSHFIHPDEKGD